MDSDHIMNIFVYGFWPPSHLLPHAVVSLQNALNTAAKIGGQLYKASEAEGDTRDALFQVRETERDRERIDQSSCVYSFARSLKQVYVEYNHPIIHTLLN